MDKISFIQTFNRTESNSTESNWGVLKLNKNCDRNNMVEPKWEKRLT